MAPVRDRRKLFILVNDLILQARVRIGSFLFWTLLITGAHIKKIRDEKYEENIKWGWALFDSIKHTHSLDYRASVTDLHILSNL